jgi:hypothetical protein
MNQSNLNVNNARRMTPQAARVFLKNAKGSEDFCCFTYFYLRL